MDLEERIKQRCTCQTCNVAHERDAKDSLIDALLWVIDRLTKRVLNVTERRDKHKAEAQHWHGKAKDWIETSVYAAEKINELEQAKRRETENEGGE